MQSLRVRLAPRKTEYEIKVEAGLLTDVGRQLRGTLGHHVSRVALFSNKKVFALYGDGVLRNLRASDFRVSTWLMKDGEQHKSLQSFQQAVNFLSTAGLERSDVVVALGGGVVGDLAGFAAATYLRGIAFIQIPTTLLAQIDASVGGKTGVNLRAGKNLVGAFHQPRLVLIDTETLRTLPPRELTSGWCEAIKQGAAGDRKLFDRTMRLLSSVDFSLRKARRTQTKVYATDVPATELAAVIAAHCRFKASIVAGDERESIDRSDPRSRRILNFGHTTAHALEAITGYRRFRHGEAVGYGMVVAGEISKHLGMLEAVELRLLRDAVRACGPLPRATDIDVDEVMRAMKSDKKSLDGKIKWVLLERIGSARIVEDKIERSLLRRSLREGLRPL